MSIESMNDLGSVLSLARTTLGYVGLSFDTKL